MKIDDGGASRPLSTVVRHWRTILEVGATLLVVVVCVDFLWARWTGGTPPPPTGQVEPPPPPAALPAEPVSLERAALEGDPAARIAIVEFSDFECPFCGRFARETRPALVADYVSTGKLLLAFRHLPLESIHKSAFAAAVSAECARRQDIGNPSSYLLVRTRGGERRMRAAAGQVLADAQPAVPDAG